MLNFFFLIIIVGSGNLTGRGMGLLPISNKECGIFVETTQIDLNNIQQYLIEAVSITDDIYTKYLEWIKKNKNFQIQKIPQLPDDLISIHKIKNNKIWVKEFPWCYPKFLLKNQESKNEIILHEKELFGFNPEFYIDDKILCQKFNQSRIFEWFKEQIINREKKLFFFGELTELIHNSLFDDPTPYRKEVKQLQNNLIEYIKYFNIKGFKFEKPNFTEKISYTV